MKSKWPWNWSIEIQAKEEREKKITGKNVKTKLQGYVGQHKII